MRVRLGLFASLICLFPLLSQWGCANVASSASQRVVHPIANVAPSIVTQPTGQTINSGQTATFSVTASATAPLSYQWEKNGAAITGATSSSYTTPPTTTAAQFTVVVSDSAGSVTSSIATLTVNAIPVTITVNPVNLTLEAGSTQVFSGNASGTSNNAVTWTVSGSDCTGAACGTISPSGLYVAPMRIPSPPSVTVRATSGADPSKSASASVTIVAAVAVLLSLSPANASVVTASTQLFNASVTGTSNTAVTWNVAGPGCNGEACGTISPSGLYVAPKSIPSPPSVTVRAISAADPSKSASASVTIVAAVAVLLSLSPANASVATASTQSFNASVTGASNTAVSWTVTGAGCNGAACGSLSTSGLRAVYSAPSIAPSPATVRVTAVSAADSTKSAAANVTVGNVVAVTVSPSGLSISSGTTQQFNARVTGSSNTIVSWSVRGAACSGAACGTISSGGLYTAPGAIPSPANVAIAATSSADPSKSGVGNLTIVAPGKIGATLPTLPQATVDLKMPVQGTSPCPTLTSGSNCIRNVPAGDAVNFQKAISAATCGDTIVLVAGSTYSGNFTIPQTTCTNNSGWMIIKSSASASLPASNNRVGPSNASNMARVSTPNTSPAFDFQLSSNHWRIIGLEITTTMVSTVNTVYNLVLSDGNATATQSRLPAYIIFDRIYLHGLANTNVTRGIDADFQANAVVDSYCDEIHANGQDAQCFASWNGAGPFLIQNNFIQAAGENILFGGADPAIINLVPSDITIVGNLFQKNLTWRNEAAPYNWVVKNLFELKNAQRVLFDGNVLQYDWAAGQDEAMILRTVNQSGGCPWCVVQNITITNNFFNHVCAGIVIAANVGGTGYAGVPSNEVLVQNNVLADVSANNWGGGGTVFTISGDGGPLHDIIIDHNTSFPDQTSSTYTPKYMGIGDVETDNKNLQITNNISNEGLYGIFGSSVGSGTIAMATYFPGSYTYNDLVLINASGTSDGTYPTGTFWSTNAGVGFANYAGGNYQLLTNSAYHNAGTDGKDIGVWDWVIFNNEISNTIAGTR